MIKDSLCAVVLALSTAACVSKTAYTPPADTTVRYILVEKACPSPEKIVENRPEQKIEEKKPDPITPEYHALLDTIAWAEGTDCHYNMMMGRMLFKDYSAHPIETKEMPEKGFEFGPRWRKRYSTAAGRYQFLYKTYNLLKGEGFFQTVFSPEEQDRAAIYLIQKNEITQEVLEEAIRKKEFTDVWDALSGAWASLPHKKTKRSRYRFQYASREDNLEKIFFHFYETHTKP